MFQPKSTVALVANGYIEDYAKIAERIRLHQQVIAVDGGLNHCKEMGIQPDLILGDFDSTSIELLDCYPDVPKWQYPSDKDETDLELALSLSCASTTQHVTIFGALRFRMDHTLGNLHLLRRYPGKAFIETEIERIFACEGTTEIHCTEGQTISLIPLGGPVNGVYSKGLKWELEDASFDKYFISISNICLTSPVQLRIAEGDLLCFLYLGQGR